MRHVHRPEPSPPLARQLASQSRRVRALRTHAARYTAADVNWNDPHQAFHWRNLILACQNCQNVKGTRFPSGLLNPAGRRYHAPSHLLFEPKSGQYVPRSARGIVSEPIFGWARDRLPEYRANSFSNFQARMLTPTPVRPRIPEMVRVGEGRSAAEGRIGPLAAHSGIRTGG